MELRKGKPQQSITQVISQTLKIALLGVMVISTLFFLNQVKLSQLFPIKTVKLYGIRQVEQKEAQQLLLPAVLHGFFAINVESIRDRLRQLPWVADITVRRQWPDEIDITMIEKVAIAKWNKKSLLSDAGELFMPPLSTHPADLPNFIGPEGTQITMLQYFNAMNRILLPIHATISTLEMTPYATWKLILSNGIALQTGHKEILTRLRHFVKVYPKTIGPHVADVEYIDLRYSNGMAVRWKAPVLT